MTMSHYDLFFRLHIFSINAIKYDGPIFLFFQIHHAKQTSKILSKSDAH